MVGGRCSASCPQHGLCAPGRSSDISCCAHPWFNPNVLAKWKSSVGLACAGIILLGVQEAHLILSAGSASLPSSLLPVLALHPPGFLGPPYCLVRCDLTPGKHFYMCSFTVCSFSSMEVPALPQEPSSLPPAQSQQVSCKTKAPAEHCQPACPMPSHSQQSPKPGGVDIVIARKLFIYHDLSDITVNAFQSTRSVKINCKEIKTAN